MSDFPPCEGGNEGYGACDDASRIKARRRKRRHSHHFCPQCGQFREMKAGIFEGRKQS